MAIVQDTVDSLDALANSVFGQFYLQREAERDRIEATAPMPDPAYSTTTSQGGGFVVNPGLIVAGGLVVAGVVALVVALK